MLFSRKRRASLTKMDGYKISRRLDSYLEPFGFKGFTASAIPEDTYQANGMLYSGDAVITHIFIDNQINFKRKLPSSKEISLQFKIVDDTLMSWMLINGPKKKMEDGTLRYSENTIAEDIIDFFQLLQTKGKI